MAEKEKESAIVFDTAEFEKHIPHKMRFKETNLVNGTELYWVTQEIFTAEDLREFRNAVKEYGGNITKFYVTVRDLSGYNFEEDMARGVLATVTRDMILKDDYLRAAETAGLGKYLNAEDVPPETETEPAAPPRREETGKHDYTITDDDIGVNPPLERFWNNIAAIETLKKIESENRLATAEEQEILTEYVGWGGLSEYFEETTPGNDRLRELLTDGEYKSAMNSTLTSFYTPPVVIKAMWKVLENAGLTSGRVLEPACGIGNFFGLKPPSMAGVSLYGVELDDISGRIAKQLYQNANITVGGFEETAFPDNYFDAAIGNVPFGRFKVSDRRYDKYNFLIHDYFFAKTLDKVRPGGIVAFITSKGTMDKANPSVRKYIARRAELLGAVRLPNTAFKAAAGTETTSDILFLQKRDRVIDVEPDWINREEWPGLQTYYRDNNKEVKYVNTYFVQHPEMVLGRLCKTSGPFGVDLACVPYLDWEIANSERNRDRGGEVLTNDLSVSLNEAAANIRAEIPDYEYENIEPQTDPEAVPADPDIRNYSYGVIDGKVYFREDAAMKPVTVPKPVEKRIRGLIAVRDCLREVIRLQTDNYSDREIADEQAKLNRLYDGYVAENGRMADRANRSAFGDDGSYMLLCSLEKYDGEGKFLGKADIFNKRTIKQKVEITHTDTALEALAVSMSEKAKADLPYIERLTGKSRAEVLAELKGAVFRNPKYALGEPGEEEFLPAGEYLSGNVREKLRLAEKLAETDGRYAENVTALTAVQPKDLTAAEISVQPGATWIPLRYYQDFLREILMPGYGYYNGVKIDYYDSVDEWKIRNKKSCSSVAVVSTYGTKRANGLEIFEDTLNLRDTKIYDYVVDPQTGNKKGVLNRYETAAAQGKQEMLKRKFVDWIWSDALRRSDLTAIYNEKFNNIRPREYDGSGLSLPGINPEITLKPHQLNGIAHILYGGNTLLAHTVGAGKTFEMAAAAMELKRLGLCRKSMIVVPNHITEQWATEFLTLYPAANLLVATKKDFETQNRRKFCSRIATGDYDAVIIGQTQLNMIPMSVEYREQSLYRQREEALEAKKEYSYDRLTVKELQRAINNIERRLKELNNQERKDDVVTFEELGVDMLFVDEAHYYKNLYVFTKMRNVAGIAQAEAQKSSDLYMKCQYLNSLKPGRGVVFATGTPITNTMVELYTLQRYLQYDELKEKGLLTFDKWASAFGEKVTSIEQNVSGNGFQIKTRFARFYNLPELMNMFKQTADIQTADMLNLPVPAVKRENVVLKASETQKDMIKQLGARAELIKSGQVKPDEDNMLCITNDGRKLALDQRLLNPLLPESKTGKISACAENVYGIWKDTAADRLTQLVFCDLSTPKKDGDGFSAYNDLQDKLTAKGIPADEIAFIHNAKTEKQKDDLFQSVREGKVRVLIGSTEKMGSGTNVQDKLIALHHLDCPWRPSDLQQREGRIVRQGNKNPEVTVYTYVTEGTFDSYLYQMVEAKQKFIGQIMTSKSPARAAEDIDGTALSYAEIKALCAGDPHIKEKMELDNEVGRLKVQKSSYLSQKYDLEDKIAGFYPRQIAQLKNTVEGLKKDIRTLEATATGGKEFPPMTLNGAVYTDKKEAGEKLLEICKTVPDGSKPIPIGSYRGFNLSVVVENIFKNEGGWLNTVAVEINGALTYSVQTGTDIYGNLTRIDNVFASFPKRLENTERELQSAEKQLELAKEEVKKPFPGERELAEKTERLNTLNTMLHINDREIVVLGEGEGDNEPAAEEKEERGARAENGKEAER